MSLSEKIEGYMIHKKFVKEFIDGLKHDIDEAPVRAGFRKVWIDKINKRAGEKLI